MAATKKRTAPHAKKGAASAESLDQAALEIMAEQSGAKRKPGEDYERSLKLSKKLPPEFRPTEDNPMFEPAKTLPELTAQIKVCTRCDLARARLQAVPGEGPTNAKIMFIGEGPGQQEDRQGRPFVGPSGQYLNELLASIGMKREDVFIANVVKCRPPGNRDPQPEEIEACRVWLDTQIDLIKPKVIVTISRFAMARWFPNKKISDIHGKAYRFGDLVLVAMFHPAAALHNPKLKPVMEEDFKKLPEYIKNPGKIPYGDGQKPKDEPPPQQLKMF